MVSDSASRFEMDRLLSYDNESLIAELQRVASLLDDPVVTRDAFRRHARASTDTYVRRFGGWREALAAAGLGHRYSGQPVSKKMRDQRARHLSAEDIIRELQRIAARVGSETITRADLLQHSSLIGEKVVLNRFGTWQAALDAAGLKLSPLGRRWTDEDYFENLLEVWTHYGRAPKYAEMDGSPSRITSGAYAAKFGSWGRAKLAFVERVNSDIEVSRPEPKSRILRLPEHTISPTKPGPEDRKNIPLGLRYSVLRRDRFRCTACGRSPATDPGCVLHVDHIVPSSRNGKTVSGNLRALCESCNIGRGNRYLD